MIKELMVIKKFVKNLDEIDNLYKANEFLVDKELIISVLNKNNSKLDKKDVAEYVEFKIREDEDYLLTTYERYSSKECKNCRVVLNVNDNVTEYNILHKRLEKIIKIAKENCFSIKEIIVILKNTNKCKLRIFEI